MTNSNNNDPQIFDREKVLNHVMRRFINKTIDRVSEIEYTFRKTIKLTEWDDTLATIENELYGVHDGYLYPQLPKRAEKMVKFVEENEDKVTPQQKSQMEGIMHDVFIIWLTINTIINEEEKMYTIQDIKDAMHDIIRDDEWVNDSQTMAEHKGIVSGLNMLVNHFTETK